MFIKQELDFADLKKECWNYALDTLAVIEKNNKQDEFMSYLSAFFSADYCSQMPTITDVNDFLRYESDHIYSVLNIQEND